MTKEQIEYLSLPEVKQHFELVIKHKQHFQRSHDIASRVLTIAADVLGHPIDMCANCQQDAYSELQTIYQKETNGGIKTKKD